ncbi:hypothetical protein BJ944DRAFT_291645 [Cunninghamella echinulata]|nr:hypothetical protein BJ944DRAFT_291645 [Cunninghamella echinulata]
MEKNTLFDPTPKMYRTMVGFLTTTCRYQDKDQPITKKMMKLCYSYFEKFKQQQQSASASTSTSLMCINLERLDWAHDLLNDAAAYHHHHGKRIIGRQLVDAYMAKDNLRSALDLYFDLIYREGSEQDDFNNSIGNGNSATGNDDNGDGLQKEMLFPIQQTKVLLIKSSKAKYQMDMYKLYQYMMKTSPLSLDLKLYTRIIQTFIRTKHYQYAQQIVHDALRQSHIYQSTTSTLHTNRFFNIIYSLCSQTGDLELFQKVVSIQRAVGLNDLHHHSLTSLMSTYMKANQIPSAKAVFEHLNQSTFNAQNDQQQSVQPSQQHQQQNSSFEENRNKSGVDVVDYNLLLLATTLEEKGNEPIASNVLDILRQMSDRGISPNKTTLRTLLTIYKEDGGPMEMELFHQLLNDAKATREDHIWLNNMKLTKLIHPKSSSNNNHNEKEKNVLLATQLFLSNQRENLFPTILSSSSQPILANSMTYKILLDQLTKYPRHAHLAHTVYQQMRSKGWRPSTATYEQLMIMWIQKGRYQKMKTIMKDYCHDMGLQHPPTKMYTMVLDHLMNIKKKKKDNGKSIQYWMGMVKENNIHIDPLLEKRLKEYGLYDHFSSSAINTSPSPPSSSSL